MAAQYANGLKPNHAFHGKGAGAGVGDGTSPHAARFDDSRLAALSGVTAQATPVAIKPTANIVLNPGAHTATGAVDAVFTDLAAARTSVNALSIDVEIALLQHDNDLANLVVSVEARLDAVETKIDLVISKLTTAGIFV